MIWVAIFAVIAAVAIALVVLVRGAPGDVRMISDLTGRAIPVDLKAFKNLVDPAETAWLAARLPGPEFRRVQRCRIRAILAYATLTGRNAALLLRLGELARGSQDPRVAEAGRQMASVALSVRLYVIVATPRLAMAYVWPSRRGLLESPLIDRYAQLANDLQSLCRLQPPTAGVQSLIAS
jgi:hypothetical protein